MGERRSAWRFGLIASFLAIALGGCGPARYHAPRPTYAERPNADSLKLLAAAHAELASGLDTAASRKKYESLLREACEVGDSPIACMELASFDPARSHVYLSHGCTLQSAAACSKLETFEVEHERKSRSEAAMDVALDVRRGCAQRIMKGEDANDVCASVAAENYEYVLKEGELARTPLGQCRTSCRREEEACEACDPDVEECSVTVCVARTNMCKSSCDVAMERAATALPAVTPFTPTPLAGIAQADLFTSKQEAQDARAAVLRTWLDARQWGL